MTVFASDAKPGARVGRIRDQPQRLIGPVLGPRAIGDRQHVGRVDGQEILASGAGRRQGLREKLDRVGRLP